MVGFFQDRRGYLAHATRPVPVGQIIWADELPHQCYDEGTAVTKGGILFSGSAEGEIHAYNEANGGELCHFDIGAGPSMASVYEYGGKERVSIYAGGNSLGDEKHGDFLWQFSLNGTGPAQKECSECMPPRTLTEKNPWPPAGSTVPSGPVL